MKCPKCKGGPVYAIVFSGLYCERCDHQWDVREWEGPK